MGERIKEHDVVALLRELPEQKLVAGRTGTVVHIYPNQAAYEVEFPMGGREYGVVTVAARDVLKLVDYPLPASVAS